MTVVVVSLGGTIASTSDGDGASPSLSGRDLVDAVPGLGDVADVETLEFATVPSPHLTYEDLLDLVERIREFDDDPGTTGVVVTQGTDVLEEAAYFVDLCYDGGTPVVFTGAMRNPSLAGPDGPANLLASVRVAGGLVGRDAGTLVCFNGRVHAAREATKTNSTNVDTFRSPEFGPLAVVEEDRVTWRRRAENPDPTLSPDREGLSVDVEAVTVTFDASTALLDACADGDAVCLAALGAGHVPPGIVPALERLREADVPIVATTRCPEGRLARNTYDFHGSERTLVELGCLYSDLNLQKTTVRTVAALAADRLDDAFVRP
ncbi:asparaginase [Halorarum salinum]|uniref:L-asparaginase n=1 Tax=Halorarum salinum TaxID=2743089 RepID=A0A7D5L8L1_9EURY|nr:asparaginase [Halobaculum salinum]QLG60447.1 asparaginase [Halobaculum salinum]